MDDHLRPGSIVFCRAELKEDLQEGLTIWKSYDSISDDISFVDVVSMNDIMLVLSFKTTPIQDNDKISDEWKIGAYKVLTPRGVVGWVGKGWVVATINDSSP